MANNPELLKMPLARDGQKSTIPETTDASTGLFSQQYGWQSINSLPPQAGGKAVKREDFNGAFNLLGGIAYYAQKGFSFGWDATQSYFKGCVVIDPADDKRYECIADVTANSTAPSADATHWRRYTLGDGVAVGIILPFAGNGAIPSGYLLCDGAAVSRTMYPDLFSVIGTTYGAGDGSTTFNVPDANQAKRFLQGDTVAGQTKSAGLPNITGHVAGNGANGGFVNWAADGAFSAANDQSGFQTTPVAHGAINATLTFDASRFSAIYGASDTVQPPALTTRYIIKAFDGQTADSALIDITQYANELAGKADRSLSNLTDAGKSFSFPSSTYLDVTSSLTWTGSGTRHEATYTAPADGYLSVTAKTSPGSVGEVSIYNESNAFGSTDSIGIQDVIMKGMTILSKGQSARIILDNSTVQNAIFVYANGEVPA